MRPSGPRISQQTCEDSGDCDIDLATGQCGPGLVPEHDFRPRYSGPICGCSPRDHHCHLRWFDPVSCRSDDDCWVEDTPVPHAIARPRRLKGRAFRACVDGERVPACEAGRCTLLAAAC